MSAESAAAGREHTGEFTDPRTPLLQESNWQMTRGERAALEGLLHSVRPSLSIELGTAQGGSLQRISTYSEEVHSFDFEPPLIDTGALGNVTVHTGDSHELLPTLLERLAEEGRNVDFALVDGDHSPDGVRRDIEDLLSSPATRQTCIVLHDTMNENVRTGILGARPEGYPKVGLVDLEFVTGYLFVRGKFRHELWGGLGLIVVDASRQAYFKTVREDRYYDAHRAMLHVQRELLEGGDGDGGGDAPEIGEAEGDRLRSENEVLAARITDCEHQLEVVRDSLSWQVTAPMRAVMERIRRR